MAFYDDQIDGRNNLSRIFIEPPDEANLSCEETDDEVPAKICETKCEVVLRSGRRLKCDKPKPSRNSKNEVVSQRTKKDCDSKMNRSSSKLVVKRNSKCDIREARIRPRRKAVVIQNSKCDKPSLTKQKRTKSNCDKTDAQDVPSQNPSDNKPENEKGKHD